MNGDIIYELIIPFKFVIVSRAKKLYCLIKQAEWETQQNVRQNLLLLDFEDNIMLKHDFRTKYCDCLRQEEDGVQSK